MALWRGAGNAGAVVRRTHCNKNTDATNTPARKTAKADRLLGVTQKAVRFGGDDQI